MPCHLLLAGGPQHPKPQRDDDAAVFGQRNELRRRHHAEAWVPPADQGLDADHLLCRQIDLRLVLEEEFVARHRLQQAALQVHALLQLEVHVGGEKLERVLAEFLGPVHRGIGILQQRGTVSAVVREAGHPDAAAQLHRVTAQVQRFTDRVHQPFEGLAYRLVGRWLIEQHDHEFVATQSHDGVGGPHGPGQARRHLDEQLVAHVVSEAVVDRLEVVQIHEGHGDMALVAFRVAQGLVQAVVEQGSVGQTRQHVMLGHVHQTILRPAQRAQGQRAQRQRTQQRREKCQQRDHCRILQRVSQRALDAVVPNHVRRVVQRRFLDDGGALGRMQ